MGLTLQLGHPQAIFVDGAWQDYETTLLVRFGKALPLGPQATEASSYSEDMGWSWWSEMQTFAIDQLGRDGSSHIQAVDAGCAVYIDADVEREVLWPGGRPARPTRANPIQFVKRLFRQSRRVDSAIREMGKAFGGRQGEYGSLQVSGLRGLIEECDAIALKIGVATTDEAIRSLLRSYEDDDDRIDDDPHIQCLCHTMLLAREGLQRGVPLWLVK